MAKKTKKCPECNGDGVVLESEELEDGTVNEFYMKCKNCDGTGIIEDDEDEG